MLCEVIVAQHQSRSIKGVKIMKRSNFLTVQEMHFYWYIKNQEHSRQRISRSCSRYKA
jgi:hypothetical protein